MIRRDYYTVALPGDLASTVEALASHAIDEARERARLYCTPARWTATVIKGEPGDNEIVFRVRRERNAPVRRPV